MYVTGNDISNMRSVEESRREFILTYSDSFGKKIHIYVKEVHQLITMTLVKEMPGRTFVGHMISQLQGD